LAVIDAALKAAHGNPAVLDTAGWIHCLAGKTQEAIPLLSAAVKAAPSRGLYHFHLGIAYARQRQTAQAETALRQAIELNPDGSFVEEARQTLAGLRP
jgi:Flp pilus assembly protein TadD